MAKILVTGGLGYIGSHTAVSLLDNGDDVIIADNLSNSKLSVLNFIEKITGKKPTLYQIDLCDKDSLSKVFMENTIDSVIHFAGLKSVGESVAKPLYYYNTNLISTINLLETMQENNVLSLVFSSSATVYGDPERLPIDEECQTGLGITNPYGRTKFMIEEMLKDLALSNPKWQITILRYFNPIGAHESGFIGENPNGIPNNLLPYVAQVASGKLDTLMIYGNDYDTPDGTGLRDYIHVVDLANGHLKALVNQKPGINTYNLGTGQGTSVLEIIKAFEKASDRQIKYKITDRRPGDVAACYADTTKANQELEWKTKKSIEDACRDAWRWQQFCQTLE